jgi:dihydropteroate synthase
MPKIFLQCGKYQLTFDRPLIMGVINVTPDSFSDGGSYNTVQSAIDHGLCLIEEGADILDIGGESTRPGAAEVGLDEELKRVIPVIEGLAHARIPLSIDTNKPRVMIEAVHAGADMINDVNALQAKGALEAAAETQAAVCLMHKKGDPISMQKNPVYENVLAEIGGFLETRINAAQQAGISASRLVIDPGFGFGKTMEHNLAILRQLDHFKRFNLPLMVGISRKSMLGNITGRSVEQRVYASITAAFWAALKGANIIRVHDVAATCDAMKILAALEN